MKRHTWAMIVALGLTAGPAFGQDVFVQKQKADAKQASDAVVADKIKVELAQQMKLSVMGRVIKGAPYSAETSTESLQTLVDGNRIVNRTTTKVYRDSEGRTRTEQVDSNEAHVVTISDPTTGTTYTVFPAARTAYESGAVFMITSDKTAEGDPRVNALANNSAHKFAVEKKVQAASAGTQPGVFTYSTPSGGNVAFAYTVPDKGTGNMSREELGDQVIEGVTATGTRTTTVIPAGAIGNDRPINVVLEEWSCKDLGILVLTKYSDPRSGETTYRVTNISRLEPDPSLFRVPADYSVQSSKIKRDDQ